MEPPILTFTVIFHFPITRIATFRTSSRNPTTFSTFFMTTYFSKKIIIEQYISYYYYIVLLSQTVFPSSKYLSLQRHPFPKSLVAISEHSVQLYRPVSHFAQRWVSHSKNNY